MNESYLTDAAAEIVSIGVSESAVQSLCEMARRSLRNSKYGRNSIRSWLKVQAISFGMLSGGDRCLEMPDVVTAILHVFPIDFTETPEMLARLKNERACQSSVARSKIMQSASEVRPINRVAAKVSPAF